MARKRTGTVQESDETLRILEIHYRGEPQEIRLRLLRLIKETPSQTTEELSARLGCSERSVRRWWSCYTAEGLDGLLEGGNEEQGTFALYNATQLRSLRKKIVAGELPTLEEVRTWIRESSNMHCTLSEVKYLLRMELGIGAHHIMKLELQEDCGNRGVQTDAAPAPEGMLQLLNTLPLASDTDAWIEGFRTALLRLFPAIDHIVVNVRQTCDLRNPESYRPDLGLTQHVPIVAEPKGRGVITTHVHEGRQCDRLIEELRLQGRPLDRYHPPLCFDYYYMGCAYLGTILLLRECGKPPIPQETIDMVDALEPFMIYAMANHVMWYQQTRPADQIFLEGVYHLAKDAQLSVQERKVVVYHLLGYSYEEMADLLAISAKTVKKHINAIHHKTGIHRQRELFARYLSPRIIFSTEPGGNTGQA